MTTKIAKTSIKSTIVKGSIRKSVFNALGIEKTKQTTSKFNFMPSACLLFFVILLTNQSGIAQAWGGRTGTNSDTYVINRDHSNHKAVLRLQDPDDAFLMLHSEDKLYFNYANSISEGTYGAPVATLSKTGLFTTEDGFSVNPGEGKGLRFWNNNQYKISMGHGNLYGYGPVTDYSIKMDMGGSSARGFTWGVYNQAPTAALSNKGEMQLAESLAIGDRLIPGTRLTVDGRVYISENGGNEKGFSNMQGTQRYDDFLLWVEEGIVSKDFAIASTLDWPDYVFSDDYNLSSLEKTESYIKKNGHLQTLPTAEFIEKNGFTVTDMTKRMVKTIEELTLHTIEQQKQIDAQKSLFKALAIRLTALELQEKN